MDNTGQIQSMPHNLPLRPHPKKMITMPKAKLLLFEDLSDWDTFVESSDFGSIYHTSGWKNALEKNFEHIKGHLVVIRDGHHCKILSGIPVYTLNSKIAGKRLVSIPFALHGTPLVSEIEHINILIEAIFNKYSVEQYTSLEIRSILPNKLSTNKLDLSKSTFYKSHTLHLCYTPEKLLTAFHKKAVRIPIRKSLQNGLRLKVGDNMADLLTFYEIYKNLIDLENKND